MERIRRIKRNEERRDEEDWTKNELEREKSNKEK